MQYLKRENSKFEEQNLKLKKKKKDNIDPVLATPWEFFKGSVQVVNDIWANSF